MNSQLAVIGQCSDGSTALEIVLSSRPDVALIDSDLPGMDSIDLIRRLRASDVPIRLILLVNRGEDDAVSEALSAGVDGYVLKSSPARQLLDALLPKPAERVQLRQMSRRELEILRMVRGEHSEVTSRFKSAPTIEDGCWECGEPFGAGEEPVEVELSESEWEMTQFPLPQFPQRGP